MRVTPVLPVLVGFALAAACGGNSSGSKVGATGGTSNIITGSGGFSMGNGGSSSASGGSTNIAGSTAFDPDAACATTSANGEPIPVDLYFMVDITGSMNCPVPDDPNNACEVDPGPPYSATTRWTVESAALKAFVDSAKNQGLGVGINFFPTDNGTCNSSSYVTPLVEIGTLPAAAANLDKAIAAQNPAGQTPTVPSLDGAIQHATAWAKAHPTHRVAVVYATDGYPKGCTGNTIPAAAALAAKGVASKPSISTYVLGVGPNLDSLDSIASSGGTTKAYHVDTGGDAAGQLAAALSSIRSNAVLGCTYTVPAPPAGQTLDPNLVNVRFTDASGKSTDVFQDPSTTCKDGWQYSPDQTQIQLCGAICSTIEANPGGHLEVLFGCQTQVNVPK